MYLNYSAAMLRKITVLALLAAATAAAGAPPADLSAVPKRAGGEPLPAHWHHGAFMEIFVRAYADSDGDGIGDLNGLTAKLDYLQDLGIKGLWLMPVTASADRQGAERRLDGLAEQHGVSERAERRVAVGDPVTCLAQIAAEEAADVIVVGARARGWRRRLESPLADDLERETPVPVLIAPPATRPRHGDAASNGTHR